MGEKKYLFLFGILLITMTSPGFAETFGFCNPDLPNIDGCGTALTTSTGDVYNTYINNTYINATNSSWNESYANGLYYSISNPNAYINLSTSAIVNTTRLLNQSCPSGYVVNGTFVNGTFKCIQLYNLNCPTGFVVNGTYVNGTLKCTNGSLLGTNYWTRVGTGSFARLRPITLGNMISSYYEGVGSYVQEVLIGTNLNSWNGFVPNGLSIALNGSNQFNNPIWLTQGFHAVYSGQALGFSINSEYVRYPNYSYSGSAIVFDGRTTNGKVHIYTYDNDTIGTKNEPFRIDEDNNIIMQTPDYENNGNVFIGNNTGSARLLVQGYENMQCNGTLDCSIYDAVTCATKTEACSVSNVCEGTHSTCDNYDNNPSCTSHDCSASESCSGTLDCSVYGDWDCTSHSGQCSWDGMNCNNNGACSNMIEAGDCNSYNGCSWYVDCYGDTHVCQQSECDASSDGCYNSFLSCDNSATCGSILYANCNDYNNCSQTEMYPDIKTSIFKAGFGQTDDVIQCEDNSGSVKSFFDNTCAFGTNLPLTTNINITKDLYVGGNFSAKRPFGMFSDNTTQIIASPSTAQVVNFSTTEDSYKITLTNKQNFTVGQSGRYLIEVSAIMSVDTANKHIEFWIQKTNTTGQFVNLARSNTKMELTTPASEIPLAVPFIIDMNTVSKVRFMIASDDAGSSMVYTTNTSYSPASPSIIVTWTKISDTP